MKRRLSFRIFVVVLQPHLCAAEASLRSESGSGYHGDAERKGGQAKGQRAQEAGTLDGSHASDGVDAPLPAKERDFLAEFFKQLLGEDLSER